MAFADHVQAMEDVRVALQRVLEREPMADPRAVAQGVLGGLSPTERDALALEALARAAAEGA